MVIRQQISDFISYGKIKTTLTKAKESKRHIEKIITLGKTKTIANTQKMASILVNTKLDPVDKLISKIYELGKKYATRKGGYTRILKLGTRSGDRTEEAILELV
jgi:large subunit ribosomal protein L17